MIANMAIIPLLWLMPILSSANSLQKQQSHNVMEASRLTTLLFSPDFDHLHATVSCHVLHNIPFLDSEVRECFMRPQVARLKYSRGVIISQQPKTHRVTLDSADVGCNVEKY